MFEFLERQQLTLVKTQSKHSRIQTTTSYIRFDRNILSWSLLKESFFWIQKEWKNNEIISFPKFDQGKSGDVLEGSSHQKNDFEWVLAWELDNIWEHIKIKQASKLTLMQAGSKNKNALSKFNLWCSSISLCWFAEQISCKSNSGHATKCQFECSKHLVQAGSAET